jgi:hypothetical protein
MDFNEFALVVFFITLCLYNNKTVMCLCLALLVLLWVLNDVNVKQLMHIEGMRNNGNTTSITVYLLFIVVVVLFLKGMI